MVTPTAEEYLKAVYRLQAGESRVAPCDVATAMGVKPQTVTKTLRRMCDDGLVDYESYRGAVPTESGETDHPLSLPVDPASNVSLARPDGASVSDDGRYDEEK